MLSAVQRGGVLGGVKMKSAIAAISAGFSFSPKPAIWVAGRPRVMTPMARFLCSRCKLPGSRAGPVLPSRSAPWHSAQLVV